MASMAYSTWKIRPSGENVLTPRSYSDLVRNIATKEIIEYNKTLDQLLFISYKLVKGFLAITFLLLVIFSWDFHDVCQRFLYGQKPNFSWIRQKNEKFPHKPPL